MQRKSVAYNVHSGRRVVTLHSYDLETFGPDPGPNVALFDDVALDGPSASG